ncbi:MAG: MATE family efflux transporter [Lachnospiraceae bacterium]|nr:MATE family efflux transporter [Lachnospiraceae bacterium]
MADTAKKIEGTKDLTEGKPMKLILGFGLPLLFGLLFQQFYNMVDSIIVGQKLGVNALAAVGSTGSINFMILGFCIGVCNGFAIPVAQAFGAKNQEDLKKYIANCLWVSILFAALITGIMGVLTRSILIWMKTPVSIIDDAYTYIFVIFMGIPAIFLYNMIAAILRSLGDSVAPVVFLIFSSLLNIVLDLILITHMGVMGAAVATVSAQAVSGIVSLFYTIYKYKSLAFTGKDWKFSSKHALTLCGMGVPMGLQYSITAIGSVILQTAVNRMGENVVAAVTAGSRISMFACCPFDAMGSTMATYGGQNVGAKQLDRIDEGIKDCSKLGIGYSVIAFLFMLVFGQKLALLFVKPSETELIHYIYLFLLGNSGLYILLAFVNIVRFMIQGLGYSAFAVIAGICEMFARGIAGFLLVPRFGYIFVMFASPLAWLFADLFLIPAYLYVMKRLRRKFQQTTEPLP